MRLRCCRLSTHSVQRERHPLTAAQILGDPSHFQGAKLSVLVRANVPVVDTSCSGVWIWISPGSIERQVTLNPLTNMWQWILLRLFWWYIYRVFSKFISYTSFNRLFYVEIHVYEKQFAKLHAHKTLEHISPVHVGKLSPETFPYPDKHQINDTTWVMWVTRSAEHSQIFNVREWL